MLRCGAHLSSLTSLGQSYAELGRTVPDGAAVRPQIIRIREVDGQKTVYHQLTNSGRPEKGRSVTLQCIINNVKMKKKNHQEVDFCM